MSGNIFYFCRCQNNPSGNGGDKRVSQLCEILKPFAHEFYSTCDHQFTIPQKLNDFVYNTSSYFQKQKLEQFKKRITYSTYYKWSEVLRPHLLHLYLLSNHFIDNLKDSPKLFIVDDPVFVAPVVLYANKKGIPVVAFTQNIETLSREQVEHSFQREMFLYELDLLSKCDLVVTISTEETWLLRNFGLDPLFLPYFPVKRITERMDEVRNKRAVSNKSGYLLMGTVYNLPTLDGMKRVISAVTNDDILQGDKLTVAGYGTGQLLGHLDNPHIDLRGDVTNAELDELLVTTRGCIVYQETGSGALTKIPELLLAGVPVIINSHAARSHHNLPGIFEFETLDQLGQQLRNANNNDRFPQVLTPPDTSFLQKRILQLIK